MRMKKIQKLSANRLSEPFQGYWRYRIGDYRLITEIVEKQVIIVMINIGHHIDVYK